jgi:2-polyprenyl-3-methyl-5-hydroxy-6-metoxy-1,4-benzoquinol methylase
MPSSRALKELYSGDYEFNVDRISLKRFELTAHHVIETMKKSNPSGKSLLDIGTGYGTLVHVASLCGLDALGIEPARNLYKLASKKLKSKVVHSDLKSFIRTNTKKFDFISAIHVIEHIRNPSVFLKAALKLLKNRGVLYIETPNSYGHLATYEKKNYTFLTPPDHINLFSKTSLQLLIDKIDPGLAVHFSTYSYPEHLVGILRAIKRGTLNYHLSSDSSELRIPTLRRGKDGNPKTSVVNKLPFFDRVVAPIFTPLLNIGNKGSFLQLFIQKLN